eukprot:COSAG02_NODE_5471_length_4296_cov_3.282345_6_plen_94_part_00
MASGDGLPQAICSTFEDAARAIRCCVEADLSVMPSKHECFFILPDIAGQVYDNGRAKELLQWEAVDHLTEYWTRLQGPIETASAAVAPAGARL